MITQTAEHALRALLYLAQQPDGTRVSAEAVAEAIGAPRNYLSKTLHQLARRGIVSGTRGPNGGFRLDVAPGELSLSRVIGTFEPTGKSSTCLLGGRRCDGAHPCRAHDCWTRVWGAVLAPLEETTLWDLLQHDVTARPPAAPTMVPG